MACVMIDRYTPLTRERNAKKPNSHASTPGTSTTSSAAQAKCPVPCQNQGSSFQSRKTMKSGRSLWYTPSRPMARIRYIPIA